MYNDSFDLGVKLAAAALNIPYQDILIKKAAEDIVQNSFEEQQLYSKAGANILALSGDTQSVAYRVLCKCASAERVLPKEVQTRFIQPVKEVLTKSAFNLAGIGGMAANAMGSIGATTLFSILAAGALTGGAVWGLNRAMTTDDANTAAKFKQAKKYKQLANEIRSNLEYQKNQGKSKAVPKNTPHGSDDYLF